MLLLVGIPSRREAAGSRRRCVKLVNPAPPSLLGFLARRTQQRSLALPLQQLDYLRARWRVGCFAPGRRSRSNSPSLRGAVEKEREARACRNRRRGFRGETKAVHLVQKAFGQAPNPAGRRSREATRSSFPMIKAGWRRYEAARMNLDIRDLGLNASLESILRWSSCQ